VTTRINTQNTYKLKARKSHIGKGEGYDLVRILYQACHDLEFGYALKGSEDIGI